MHLFLGLNKLFFLGLRQGEIMITLAESKKIVAEFGKEFGTSEKDSGCVAVQVALVTARINNLPPHFANTNHFGSYHAHNEPQIPIRLKCPLIYLKLFGSIS